VIVDLAVEAGGNCPLSEPGKVVLKHGVKIIGYTNYPSRIAVDASALYAKNLLNFLGLIVDKKENRINIDPADDIIKGTMLTRDGSIVHSAFAPATAA
jgi:NAD(P) transhydrogenase subunit alpha